MLWPSTTAGTEPLDTVALIGRSWNSTSRRCRPTTDSRQDPDAPRMASNPEANPTSQSGAALQLIEDARW